MPTIGIGAFGPWRARWALRLSMNASLSSSLMRFQSNGSFALAVALPSAPIQSTW